MEEFKLEQETDGLHKYDLRRVSSEADDKIRTREYMSIKSDKEAIYTALKNSERALGQMRNAVIEAYWCLDSGDIKSAQMLLSKFMAEYLKDRP